MRLPTIRLPAFPTGAVDALRANALTILAVGFIVITALGYVYFYLALVGPALDARNKLAAQVSDARAAAQARGILPQSPDSLQARLNNVRATLTKSSQVFLTDAQISDYIKRLYLYADESRITIIDLQTTVRVGATPPTATPTATRALTPTTTAAAPPPPPPPAGQPTMLLSPTPTRPPPTFTPLPTRTPTSAPGADLFRVTTVRLQARGPANQLVEFVSRIRETLIPGVVLNGMNLENGEKDGLLTLELAMVASAAPETATPRTPAPAPTQVPVEPTSPRRPPTFPATVVYATLTPSPTPPATATLAPTFAPQTTYVVRAGDTLFGIARRYNTTVEAIMAANRMANYNIYIGQVLIIPR